VDIPEQSKVDAYLPPYSPEIKIDIENPRAFGGLLSPDYYMEMRYILQRDMERAVQVIKEADEEFYEIFGRKYGLTEAYKCDDAKVIIVVSSTITGTARTVIDEMRERGKKVGLLKIRFFRPFPFDDVKSVLLRAEKVAVIDRNISYGAGGIFFQEVKSALYNESKKPPIFGFITGLGGRDVTPEIIREIIEYTEKNEKPEENILWRGVMR